MSCLKYTWWGADPSLLIRIYKALIRSRLEFGGFLFHNLSKKLHLMLDRIQFLALRIALGYRMSTPTNIILDESGELTLDIRFEFIGKMFLLKVLSYNTHLLVTILNDKIQLSDNPIFVAKIPDPPLVKCFRAVDNIVYLLNKGNIPFGLSVHFSVLIYSPNIDIESGLMLAESRNPNSEFKSVFGSGSSDQFRIFTDGSKNQVSPYTGFSVVSEDLSTIKLFRSSKFIPIFTVESLAILEAIIV